MPLRQWSHMSLCAMLCCRQLATIDPCTQAVFRPFFKNGMICLNGDVWRKHVRVLGPMVSAVKTSQARHGVGWTECQLLVPAGQQHAALRIHQSFTGTIWLYLASAAGG